jgi:hypothetical protein
MAFLRDGQGCLLAIQGIPFSIVEKEVGPPGVDTTGPINITNMRNLVWRTMFPKTLMTFTELACKVQYDPVTILTLKFRINSSIGVQFPDGTIYGFWGYVDKFKPEVLKEGTEALADLVVVPTMLNAAGFETNPVVS